MWDKNPSTDPHLELGRFALGFPDVPRQKPEQVSSVVRETILPSPRMSESVKPTGARVGLQPIKTSDLEVKGQNIERRGKPPPAVNDQHRWTIASLTRDIPEDVKARPSVGYIKEKFQTSVADEEQLLGMLGEERAALEARLRTITERAQQTEARTAAKKDALTRVEGKAVWKQYMDTWQQRLHDDQRLLRLLCRTRFGDGHESEMKGASAGLSRT